MIDLQSEPHDIEEHNDFSGEQETIDKVREATEPELVAPDDIRDTPDSAHLETLLKELAAQKQQLDRLAEDDMFMRNIRAVHEHDPFSAINIMFQRLKDDLLDSMDAKIYGSVERARSIDLELESALSGIGQSLSPFKEEIRTLIEHGMPPERAAGLVRDLTLKHAKSRTDLRSAAHEIRRKSAMETHGVPIDPAAADKDFDKILKKSSNIYEMFRNLRRL